ncbi:MAG: hypothetical protein OXC82_12205 [Rhodobacteraceae bacterium]|nr:hypothetical protein [Paracoccaceae bacterium]MCY4251181.1 hypothetical protein [Paracoccaceae bacterium]
MNTFVHGVEKNLLVGKVQVKEKCNYSGTKFSISLRIGLFLLTSCKSSLFSVLDETAQAAGPKQLRQTIQYRHMTLRFPFSQSVDVRALLEALAARDTRIKELESQVQKLVAKDAGIKELEASHGQAGRVDI